MYIPLLQSLANSHAAAASSTGSTSSSSASSPTDTTSTLDTEFLQLLSAQLKAQSPLDPNQFVAQLAQFQSLSDLTQIDELMQTLVNNTSPATSSSAGAQSAATSSIPGATVNSISR